MEVEIKEQKFLKESSTRAACLIYGLDAHYLDHLAILAILMEIPLIVTESEILQLAQKYYPNLQVEEKDYLQLPNYLVSNFDFVFSCMPRALFDEIFFFAQKFLNKRIHTIWCPHGNSDKGARSPFMEALRREKAMLVYGQKMIDFLKEKEAFNNLKACINVGNFRYVFYKQNIVFYQTILKNLLRSRIDYSLKTILYAPTWQDYEESCSFYSICPSLIEKLPSHYNLVIKLHPNLLLQDTQRIEEMISKYEHKERVIFLSDFSPVYPLLNFVDIYIGDMSSIGYDFLLFNKPMFFLNEKGRDSKTDKGLYLFRCGIEILRADYLKIYDHVERYLSFDHPELSFMREETYLYTFGKDKQWDFLKEEIKHIYPILLKEEELDFF